MASAVNDGKAPELSFYEKFTTDIGGDLGALAKLIFPQEIVAYEKKADGSFTLKFKQAFTGEVNYGGSKAKLVFAQVIGGKITSEKSIHTLELLNVTAEWGMLSATVHHIRQTEGAAKDVAVTGKKWGVTMDIVKGSARWFKSHLKLNPVAFK